MSNWIIGMFGEYVDRGNNLPHKDKMRIYDIVSTAIGFTRTNIARYRTDEGDFPSQILSTIWRNAASELKMIKSNNELKNFAKILEEKSKYWSDPQGYHTNLIEEYSMRLTEVENKLNEIIR